MATRCFSPPESWRGFRSRWRGESRSVSASCGDPVVGRLALDAGELAHRALEDAPHGPVAVERRVGVLEDHLHGPLVGRAALGDRCRRRSCRPASTSPPASGAWMPSIALASVDLPEPDSPTRPSVSPSARPRSTPTSAGIDVALLPERLRHVVDRSTISVPSDGASAIGPGSLLGDLVDPVGVVAAGEVAVADIDQLGRRPSRQMSVASGQRSTNTHVGRSAPDLGQRAGDGGQRLLGLAHAVAGQAAQQPDRVRVLRVVEHLVAPGPPRRSCRRTSRRPGRTSSGSRRGCGRSAGSRRRSRGAGSAPGRAPRPRPWRRGRWSARRARAASGRRPAPWR